MRIIILHILLVHISIPLCAQNRLNLMVRDSATNERLIGVSVMVKRQPTFASLTNNLGIAEIKNLPSGPTVVVVSHVGYRSEEISLQIPDSSLRTVFLIPEPQALGNVIVIASTRGNERIENATTKVEVLGPGEMHEESTLKPGNIASILGDISGIQIQQSSAVSGNANVRIQGLDGKYTQVLRDGMPLYGGYAGGFGILSVPPLDLKQVELIKGSSSTLYGGGAIGGLVNLISKKPAYDPEASFLINQTTLQETNLNAYYSQRWNNAGFTFFGGQTFQSAQDVNDDGFSDVPKMKGTLVHPSIFLYPFPDTWVSLGWSGSFENRDGGDMKAINSESDTAHPYFEKNNLDRQIISLLSEMRFGPFFRLSVKASVSLFNREEITNTYNFRGQQDNYYAETSLLALTTHHTIVGGVNMTGDSFIPSDLTPVPLNSYTNWVFGWFGQDTWQLSEQVKLETGLRLDHTNHYGNFLLPRIALFYRLHEQWGLRAGFGMGYITPNPLTPQIRDYSIYQIQPLDENARAEKSYSGNLEINYKTHLGESGELFINHAFFGTLVRDPLIGEEDPNGNLYFQNEADPVYTAGFDTYVQMSLPKWEVYFGYTYTKAIRTYLPDKPFVQYTPRNRAATTILFEPGGKWRTAAEASYTGSQFRDDLTKTPGYLFVAAMFEWKFTPKWSLVLNGENLLDARQSRHESLYTGSVKDPYFKTLWAPIDGRVINLCLRFRPFEKKAEE